MKLTNLSLYASAALISSVLITGCGNEDINSNPSSTTISGTASDGYLKSATVTFAGQQTTTSDNGAYSFTFDTRPKGEVLTVSGGIDEETGEVFEGELKTYLSSNSTTAHLTPITTLVASIMENNSSANLATVQSNIASSLGINSSYTLSSIDPVDSLKNGNPMEKAQSAFALKKALMVQKVIESYSKAAAASSNDAEVQANAALIYAQVAQELLKPVPYFGSTAIFDSALDIANIKNSFTNATKISRVENASASVNTIKTMINDIDTLELRNDENSFEYKSKAIEFLTRDIENSLANGDTASALKRATAGVISGGVEGISNIIESAATNITASNNTVTFVDLNTTLNASFAEYEKLASGLIGTDNNASDMNMSQLLKDIKADSNITSALNSYITNDSITFDTAAVSGSSLATIVSGAASAKNSINVSSAIGSKKTDAEIEAEIIDRDKTIDKISIENNNLTIGDVTTTISDGSFGGVIVSDTNLTTLYNISYDLGQLGNKYHGLEDGESKTVTLGVSIKNSTNSETLFVIANNVLLERLDGANTTDKYDGAFKTTLQTNTVFNGFGILSDDTNITASTTNTTSSEVNGSISYNLENILSSLESNNSSFTNLKESFYTKGKYDLKLYITGVDGVINSKVAKNISEDFNGTLKTSIDSNFSTSTFEIKGQVFISYSNSEIVQSAKTALTTSLLGATTNGDINSSFRMPTASSLSLDTLSFSSSNPDVITNEGTVTRGSSDENVTLTATLIKDDEIDTKDLVLNVLAK